MKIRFFHILLFVFIFSCSASAGTGIDLTQKEKEQLFKDKVVFREISSDNTKGKTYEAIGLVRASTDEVSRVLLKYEDYPKFKPNLSRIEIVERSGDSTKLDYTLTFPLGKVKKYSLWMRYKKEGGADMLVWEKAECSGLRECETIKDTTGYWLWQDFPEKEGYVIIVYHIYTDPGPIPFGCGWIAGLVSRNSVPDVVSSTRKRIYQVFPENDIRTQKKL
jgi:hypothetical protein